MNIMSPVAGPAAPVARASAIIESFGDRAELSYVVADEETMAGAETSCEPADEGAGVLDVALLERMLTEGIETERYAALTKALQSEFDLPPQLLRQTYVSDLSESVRLLAFNAYVDSISDEIPEPRVRNRASISSKKTITGCPSSARSLAFLNTSRTCRSDSPTYLFSSSGPLTWRK
mgnify:CR=1 FL=1